MTIRINFLPRTHQPPKRLGSMQWTIVATTVLVVASGGMYYGSVYAGTERLTRDAQASLLSLQQVKAGLAQAADIKGREDKVAQAESDLKSLMGRRWSSVLLDLRESTPQHVTWTNISVSGDTILLKGTNRGLVDVAQLLGSLVDNQQVAQVNLHFVNEKGIPITVSAKAAVREPGNTAAPAGSTSSTDNQKQSSNLPVIPAGTFFQMEFEMEIVLAAGEGGDTSNGA